MKISNWRRLGSGLLALAIAMSMCVGTVVPAAALSAGNDGSPEMNEAYAAHESLMPIGPSFNVNTLLEWTPESDPDARYSRASIALTDRTGGFVVNPKANPEAKLMLCSLANSAHDTTSAQGTEDFMSWAFNYWQYTDSFVYWSGSEEGLICCPTGEFTDAAHTNGVPVVATLGFPWGSGTGYVQQVSDFCQKAEDGSFPVADKLLEVMEYYGFDGYFFNQESYGCSAEIATRLNEMMKYMREKCPDILISWYDSMIPSGGVSYQNAVTDYNKGWMEVDENGNYCVDEFFMNYNWYQSQISTTVNTMNSINRSPYAAFAGLDVQQNCMNTSFRDYLLLDSEGKMKISFALYCPNSTLGLSTSGANFHEVEQDFYVNTASDPRVEVSDPTLQSNNDWVGMSRFFADKTPITSAPFVTNFNSGHGTGYWVDGVLSRDAEWSYQSNQDVMPTWTWIIDSEGSKLEGGYDFTDAYNGGNSIKFAGSLDAGKANSIMLYSTDVTVTKGMKMSLTYKNDDGKMKLVAYYGDATTTSYEECTQVVYDLTAGAKDTWTTTSVDLSANSGKKLYAIGMQIESETAVEDYQVNLGQLTITEKTRSALSGPSSITLDEILYTDAYKAEARIYWSSVSGATSYEVYKVNADGTTTLIMETPNTALYLPSVVRDAAEENVTLKVVAINANGVRGKGKTLTIDWLYGNDDSEKYEKINFENVCLNAEVTDVSFENSGEPASKALDGTAANNSKWCATNRSTGYMCIDIGREVTVRRWRVEHAEYGGEDVTMNTIDFALEYKNADGEWVQAKRIQNNHAAVTDVLLDEPITASEWKLQIYNDGSSPWGGIRIYEWQMFETEQFPQTEPVLMHFASAVNNTGAADTFTLTNVTVGHTVKVYTKSGDEYTLIGEQEAAKSTVTITDLDFGTEDAGRIYYSTSAVGSAESIKQSVPFAAEAAEKSAPATNVSFKKYSQAGSTSSSNGDDIFTTVTVSDLEPGDVVYVYEMDSETWTKMSQPVADGKTSVSINGVRITRAAGKLTMQVQRGGKLISDTYTVDTPAFPEPTGKISLDAYDVYGEMIEDVVYGIYNAEGTRVGEIKTAATGSMKSVELGTYTLKCEEVPEGYRINNTPITVAVKLEGRTYKVTADIKVGSANPTVTSVVVAPATVTLEKGAEQTFTATVTGEDDPSTDVVWTVEGATSENTVITAAGVLTVGEDEMAKTLTVKATSVEDSTKSATATVTIAEEVETENVALGAEVIAYSGNNIGGTSGPEKMFDGKYEDHDNDKWGVSGNNNWVAFDIGEETNVDQLRVIHAGAAGEYSPTPGAINTAGYEFYVLNESKISVEDLLAMDYEDRCELLADNSYWNLIASTTDNLADITTNDLTGTTGRIFKFNVSRGDTTGWGEYVRIYELELYSIKNNEPEANKDALKALIEQAGKLDEEDYTPNSWKTLADALADAKAIVADEKAKQDDVDAAVETLKKAILNLVETANKEDLQMIYDSLKDYPDAVFGEYPVAQELIDALANAKKVLEDANATEADVDAAYGRLADADALQFYVEMIYDLAIEVSDAIDEGEYLNYTATSWAAVEEELEYAIELIENLDYATADEAEEQYERFEAVIDELVKAGDSSKLEQLVEEAKALDLTKYTDESAEAITDAIAAAEDVIAERAIDEDLEAAYKQLEEAIENAEQRETYEGICFVDDEWGYYKNGVLDTEFAGLAQAPSGTWYYVENGYIAWDYSGIVQAPSGRWYYIVDGRIAWGFNGIAQAPSGTWYYIENGHIAWDFSGIAQAPSGTWYYVKDGRIAWNYNGIAQAPSGNYYYIRNGRIAWDFTGNVPFEGKLYKVVNGLVR